MTPLRLMLFALAAQFAAPAAQSTATIHGIIRASSGRPVGSATVELRRSDGTAPQLYSALTAGDGVFVISNIRPGDYIVTASATGYLRTKYGQHRAGDPGIPVTLASGQTLEDIQISMTMPGVISGRIVDSDGDPIGGAEVHALTRKYRGGQRILEIVEAVTSNDLGEYRLFGLVPGQYYLSVNVASTGSMLAIERPSPFQITRFVPVYFPGTMDSRAATSLDVSAGSTSNGVDFTISPVKTHHVHGVVPGGGANVTLASLEPVAGSSNSPAPKSDATKGPFDFDGVTPGRYLVIARSGDLTGSTRIDVGDTDVDGVTVTIGTGFVVPVHTSFDNHPPLDDDPDFEKVYFGLQPYPPIAGFHGDRYTPFANGTFGFEVMEGEGYRITLSEGLPDNYIKSARMGERDVLNEGLLYNGETDAKIEIVIGTKPGNLTGTIMDNARHPAVNTTVVLVPDGAARQRAEAFRVTSTDVAGRFQIASIPPGGYTLYAWESVENSAWQDPDFLKDFEGLGTRIQIKDGARDSVTASVIPAQ